MRAVWAVGLAIWTALLLGSPVVAAKRVALVIGNSAYQRVAPLANPVNDAEAMSAILTKAGFDGVDLKRDLNGSGRRRCAIFPTRFAMLTWRSSISLGTASRSTATTT
jgi:hypothetical protein